MASLRHFLEQYFGILSLSFLEEKDLLQLTQTNVQHLSQILVAGDRGIKALLHLTHFFCGITQCGTLRLDTKSGFSCQNALSAIAWQVVHRVIRLSNWLAFL